MDFDKFLNWFADKNIVDFEGSLTPDEVEKFRPYMIMFHTLKLSHKRALQLLKDNNIEFNG